MRNLDTIQRPYKRSRAFPAAQVKTNFKNTLGDPYYKLGSIKQSLNDQCWSYHYPLLLPLVGHIHRMDPSRLPKKMFYGELTDRSRQREAHNMHYKDQLNNTLKATNINPSTWKQTGIDCTAWRKTTQQDTKIRGGRMKKKDIEGEKSDVNSLNLPCQHYPRIFHYWLGLESHVKHKHW